MHYPQQNTLSSILNCLHSKYAANVTDVPKVISALIDNGIIQSEHDIENDHIAFRTLGVPNLGIASFEKIFLAQGYIKRDAYVFEQKKLNAFWYAPPSNEYPRIFLSELRVNELSESAQAIINKYTKHITTDPVDNLDLQNGDQVGNFLHTQLWDTPTKAEYLTLLEESEYAAWVIYNRYYLNHFTVSVHNLPEAYNTVAKFNTFLESIGITLNSAGGKIKTSTDGFLLQSSTVSKLKEVEFSCGNKTKIAGSYVEFAERKILPEFAHLKLHEIKPEHRKDGFAPKNADKIFESTYTSQTNKTID